MIGRVNVQVFLFTRTPKFMLLILKRIPERDGYWQPISGGIEDGEEPIDTIKQEIFEETGINELERIIDLKYDFIFKATWRGKFTTMREFCFGAEIDIVRQIELSGEHEDYKWCTEAEARRLLNWMSNLIALDHLMKLLKIELRE
jgi:dATP pyrophosphohydrolase